MNHKNGTANARDLGQRIKPAAGQMLDEWNMEHSPGHVSGIGERAFNDQAATLAPRGQVNGHGPSKGMTVHDNIGRSKMPLVNEVTIRRIRIAIDSSLSRRAFTFPIAAIIDSEYVGPESGISFELIQLLPDVRGIAVKPEKNLGAGMICQKPCVQPHSVFSSKPDFFQPRGVNSGGRKSLGIAGRKKDEAVFNGSE